MALPNLNSGDYIFEGYGQLRGFFHAMGDGFKVRSGELAEDRLPRSQLVIWETQSSAGQPITKA
ncbi:hypothetical protein [Nostoc sp.]